MENYENNLHDSDVQDIAMRVKNPAPEQFVTAENVCGFKVQNFNSLVDNPDNKQKMEELVPGIWCKNELAMLFAPTNVGKSLFAVQIASKVAREHPQENVLYFDFELSDKQVAQRYCSENDLSKERELMVARFPNNAFRASLDYVDDEDFNYLESIEKIANYCSARYVIIDNITWLSDADTDQACSASELMKSLCAMKRKYNMSMLVLAHTPKREKYAPIGLQNLAGSSKIAAFADSAFAINFSTQGDNIRYGKQCKWRNGEFTITDEHVATYEIKKVEGFTKFVQLPDDLSERDHIKRANELVSGEMDIAGIVADKQRRNISYSKLAEELGMKTTTLFNMIKDYKAKMG